MLGLRAAVDVNGVGVFTASDAIFLVNRAGYHIAVATGLRIAPGDRRPGGPRFQRLEFGDNRAPFVLVIKRRAGAIAQRGVEPGPNRCPSSAIVDDPSGGTTNRRSPGLPFVPYRKSKRQATTPPRWPPRTSSLACGFTHAARQH
jgi:hypothetical protein